MDLLINIDIVLDVCAERHPHAEASAAALQHCRKQGGRLWLYTGSVQGLETGLFQELARQKAEDPDVSRDQLLEQSRKMLQSFAAEINWLAALAAEGDVFSAPDPAGEQLIRALDRFPAESARLLTRDRRLLKTYPQQTISPDEFCRLPAADPSIPFVDLGAQQEAIRPELEANIHTVLHHGRFIMGPEVGQLEQRLEAFTRTRHCITCSSGTDALLMALMACGIGPGDAVFTSPFTFFATAEVIALLGATPVFVDIDPITFNLDPDKLESAVQGVLKSDASLYPLPQNQNSSRPQQLRAKAVIPVDLFGLPSDYDRINTIAGQHALWVIEDAAQSLGATYHGRQAGSLGHIGCTSFFPAKPLGGYGDGGAVFTDDQSLARDLQSIRVHGTGSDKYDNARIGINGRMDTLQAAVLLAKLDIFPQEIKRRQEAAERYSKLLKAGLQTPCVPPGLSSVWAQYALLARSGEHRQKLQQALQARNIPSAIYYPKPLHVQSAFTPLGYRPGDMPVSEDCAERIFSVPMHPYLREEEQNTVLECLREGML